MESSSLSRRRPNAALLLVVVLTCAVVLLIPTGVSATRYLVGGKYGWNPNVNYTEWAKKQHYYLGDWLFFVYDRSQMNVLEVNKTDYESCNSDHPLHNWTTGAGRDVVPLNVTKHYYFISGRGFCFGGMKVAVLVENLPPPPKAAPSSHKNGAPSGGAIGLLVVQVALAFAVMWALLSSF